MTAIDLTEGLEDIGRRHVPTTLTVRHCLPRFPSAPRGNAGRPLG